MIRKAVYFLLLILGHLGSQGLFAATPTQEHHFDLVVYGSTASGVMTAVSAARKGLHVALVDPGPHIGGMVAGGLSHTDTGNIDSIGGLAREFFERVGHHYNKTVEFDFEPHVAEQILNDMLREAHVVIFLDTRLRETAGVTKDGARITSVTMENGSVFSAAEFVDSSYEGDLMASAGVSNTWGREATDQYHESQAGVLSSQRDTHQFTVKVSPYRPDRSLLPGVLPAPKGTLGQADKKIPAYNFRMCFSGDKSNKVAYPKPDGYDPHQYELLARLLAARTKAGEQLVMKDIVMRDPIQGGKFDINNWGAFSTDNINASWEYPTASYKRRAEIIKEHYRYQAGYFLFLGP